MAIPEYIRKIVESDSPSMQEADDLERFKLECDDDEWAEYLDWAGGVRRRRFTDENNDETD